EPRRRVLPEARNGERAQRTRPLEPRPEADEETEGEREEHTVFAGHPGAAKDRFPAARPPRPRLGGLEPADRRPRGAGGLVDADVARERIGQVGAEGRGGGLVVGELLLRRERQAAERVPAVEIRDPAHPRRLPLPPDKRVGGKE